MPPAPAILDCERWFVRRGVPHFIVHYDASEHIWTRSLPLLVVIYVQLSWSLDQHRIVVTEELLRVAGFLATFAGLSFTVYLVTDPTYRDEFRTDVASELREAFGVRAAYRWALAGESSVVAPSPRG